MTTPREIAEAVVDVLENRKGFRHWMDQVRDEDLEDEVLDDIAAVIGRAGGAA